MWTLERRRRNNAKNDDQPSVTTITATEGSLATAPVTDLSAAESTPALEAIDHRAGQHELWRSELASVGGVSPLLHFADEPANRIELSTTHPGGLPQFISGQKILLSSLIRDDLALRNARMAAARVTDKALEMRAIRGLETVHLGVGIASWDFQGESFCAPLLLRPLAIRRYGRDFELKLKPKVFVNPALIRALHAQFGIVIDPAVFVALSQESGVFKPQPVIDKLRVATAGLGNFTVQPRLVVSSFAEVSHDMINDARSLDHPVLDAACGSERAAQEILASFSPANPISPNKRPPETDRMLLDADAQQDDIVAQIAAGNSLVVHTLPGTGGTQTVVNATGALVLKNKRVLIVTPRRATLDGIAHRMSRVGLSGMVATPNLVKRNLVESIKRNESAQTPQLRDVDEALLRLRSVLLDYHTALESVDDRFGVSPLDALRALTQLALIDDAPTTTARLGEEALSTLAMDRTGIAATLTEAAALGQFDFGPDDSPWYGVTFATTAHARSAYELACHVEADELPRALSLAEKLVAQTSLRPFETVAELGIYLRLLMGIRETLDRFVPEVYDRALTEVIAAHAPRGGDDMNPANRRRLRKLAREYVRPGAHVGDMYERLTQIQEQRILWQRYTSVVGARPEVPVGISDVIVAYQTVYQDLTELDRILGAEASADQLKNLTLDALRAKLAGLSQESEVLRNIQERTALLEQLREANLDPLLDDLSARHVAPTQVAVELEQSWWQSVLERMLQTNKALLSANTSVLNRLESDFKLVDDAHSGANGQVLAARLADEWRVALVDYAGEAKALREALKADVSDPKQLSRVAPNLVNVLAPVWIASPYEISQLPEDVNFDAVLLVDAGATTLAENVGAIARGKQIVAFGDPVTQTPSSFETAVLAPVDEDAIDHEAVDAESVHRSSALSVLGELLPTYQLTQSYRAGGEDLTTFVNTRFYDGALESLPWAGTFLGHHSLTREYVDGGQGLPDPHTGAVESPDAEVERVVDLVLEHAEQRPRESLMVITASAKHAVRLQQAVFKAFAKRHDLSDFVLGDRAEPFTVLTLEQAIAQSRDRVIFSVGYGRTPHGRVLSNFGALGRPGGERLLAVAVTRARRAMTVVSCFTAEDLDPSRVRHGVAQLAELLSFEPEAVVEQPLPAQADPMLDDLAERLRALGLQVTLDYRGAIPLAASLDGKAVAIETDYSGGEESLRSSLRLRPAVLRRLGWHYVRVHSFDLFADPEEVALRVARTIGYTSPTQSEREEQPEAQNAQVASADAGGVRDAG